MMAKYFEKNFCIINFFLTAFFAAVMVVGASFMKLNSWEEVRRYPIFSLVSFFCYWAAYFIISLLLFKKILRLEKDRKETKGGTYAKFFILWAGLLLCWLPWLIGFYPGISNSDVSDQLAQAFNFENETYLLIDNPLSDEVLINGHHPVFNTWIQGLFLRIGKLLGSQNVGIFLHALWIALLTTGVFAYSLWYMMRNSVPRWMCMTVFCIFAFVPCFPLYGINLVKNSTYSAWLYLWVILLVRLAVEGEGLLRKKAYLLLFSLSILMQMLNVKHGVHVVVLTAVFVLWAYRASLRRLLPVFLIPVLAVQIGFNGILMPFLQISPGSRREALGFFYQQTARYARDYPDEVTPEEKAAIDGVLDYDRLAGLYNPITSDPVKFEAYRKEQTRADQTAYFKVWAKQFIKHPGVYLEAAVNGCYGFFYPGLMEWYDYRGFDSAIREVGDGFFTAGHPQALSEFKDLLKAIEYNAKFLPVIGMFFRHGTYVWVMLWCAAALLAIKKYRYLAALMPFLLNILVCIVSPFNANTRYLLPVIYGSGFAVLIVISAVLQIRKGDSEQQNPDASCGKSREEVR